MPIRCVDDTVFLEGVCAVEDAEIVLEHLQSGARVIDWSDCTHLHSACFQVMLAARPPMRGVPRNPELARWLAPILHPDELSIQADADAGSETLCKTES